jgi:hypothetical protein
MIKGVQGIVEAKRAFHRFCDGAVLVAHNAPFHMAFLQYDGKGIGQSFEPLGHVLQLGQDDQGVRVVRVTAEFRTKIAACRKPSM